MNLPPLPKALRAFGSPTKEELARRVDEWATGQQALVRALRDGNPAVLRRLTDLEARPIGGGGSVTFGTPVGLTPGDTNDAGSGTDSARSNHVHALPAFGTAATEFMEGDDARVVALADYYEKWEPDAPAASPHANDDDFSGATMASWTEQDPGARFTFTASPTTKSCLVTLDGAASAGGALIYQGAVPASEFSVWARVSIELAAALTAGLQIGLCVCQDATSATADVSTVVLETVNTGVSAYQAANRVDVNDIGTQYGANPVGHTTGWVNLRCQGTALTTAYSPDGFTVHTIGSTTLAYTPSHFGIYVYRSATALDGRLARVHRLLVKSGAGSATFPIARPGRLVRVPLAT